MKEPSGNDEDEGNSLRAHVNKRLLHLSIFCFGNMLSVTPLVTRADFTEGDYTYTVTNGKATITDFTSSYSGALSITNTLGGCPVSSVGDDAFRNCSSLISVTLPEGITNIGSYAFCGCFALTNIQISGSVTGIGGAAFMDCRSLTGVTIPGGVTDIGGGTFYRCDNLGSVTIPNSVTNIGSYAFYQCIKMPIVTIGRGVTTIGKSAFASCNSLSTVAVVGDNPVYSSLEGVLFNKSQTTLVLFPTGKPGSYAIPNSVMSIGDYAFQVCNRLTGVTIPDSVASIGVLAFSYCNGLSNVTIPGTVTNIGAYAFMGCGTLAAIVVSASNSVYSSADGVLFNKSQTSLIQCPIGKSGSLTISGSVTSIGGYAFYQCTRITNLFFKGNVPTSVSDTSFSSATPNLYYLPGTTGWGTTLGGRPTLLWNPTVQRNANFGFTTNRFGFDIAGTTNLPIEVKATTNLSSGVWTSVTNATLGTSGSLYFADPASSHQGARFYRIVWP